MKDETLKSILDEIISSDRIVAAAAAIIELFFLLIIGIVLIKTVKKLVKKSLDKSEADPSVYKFILNAISISCMAVILTMCLGIIGIPVSTVIAVLGAAGAAIALALKDSLANVAGGFMIIITKPFRKNDFIDVGDVSGEVQNIDLFLTTLMTYDNKTITIPNGLINTSVLVNHSKQEKRRVDCTFSIGYGCDIGRAKEIMMSVCDMCPMVLEEPEPVIGVAGHGDNSVFMDLKAWCGTDDYWDVKYYLEENVKIAFDENDIEIPYPQMDVHIKR